MTKWQWAGVIVASLISGFAHALFYYGHIGTISYTVFGAIGFGLFIWNIRRPS